MAAKQPLVERPKGRSSILGMRQAGHDLRNEDGTTQTGASLYELSTTHECGWDYCLVFPIPNAENGETWTSDDYAHKDCKLTWQTAVPKLEKAGLQTFLFRSCQKDEMYVKIKCPMSRLEEQADVMNYKMLLDPVELKATLHSGFDFPEGHCAPIMVRPPPLGPAACEQTSCACLPLFKGRVGREGLDVAEARAEPLLDLF